MREGSYDHFADREYEKRGTASEGTLAIGCGKRNQIVHCGRR
jgi:hypothetical protein